MGGKIGGKTQKKLFYAEETNINWLEETCLGFV